jgi:hypothetical protein
LAATGSERSIRDCDTTEGTRRELWAEICHNYQGAIVLTLVVDPITTDRGEFGYGLIVTVRETSVSCATRSHGYAKHHAITIFLASWDQVVAEESVAQVDLVAVSVQGLGAGRLGRVGIKNYRSTLLSFIHY